MDYLENVGCREDPSGLLTERRVPGRTPLDYLENVRCQEDPNGLLRECGQRIQNKDYHYRKCMDRESSCIVVRMRCIVLVCVDRFSVEEE